MAHQLIFTSMRRTLIGGSGYGIAAQTPNFPKVLAEELARQSGYSEIYPASDPNRAFNPVNYLHQKAGNWHILGRICHTDNDYSGRSNYLAHYFVLEPSELAPCGPVALLQALPFLDKFEGDSRIIPAIQLPKLAASKPKPCAAWRKATGDAGWGGVLAESLSTGQPVGLLYGKNLHGPKALELVGETLALLVPADQWKISFCTHLEGYPKATSCRLKMLQEGCPTARDFRQRTDSWDLAKGSMGQPPGQDWPEYARTGILSLSEHGHANIAELDPADLDSAIESYQAPASFASPAPAMIPPPVVRVLPDEPKADSRLKKQVKPREDQSKSSVAPYLLAGGLSFLTLGIGFLAGYMPQNGTITALNGELEKLEKEKATALQEASEKEGQLGEFKRKLDLKEADLQKERETTKFHNDRTNVSDKISAELQKKHDALQEKLNSIEKEFRNTKANLAIVKDQKDPLSALRSAGIADKDLENAINKMPDTSRKAFLARLDKNRELRNGEINTEQIINNTKNKYHIQSSLVFYPKQTKSISSVVNNPILLPIISKVIQKANKNGQPIPAYQDLKDLFNGVKTDDPNKSIFWVAQGDGKPSALNAYAIETLLEYRQEIEKLYKATLKDEATVKDFNRASLMQDWKEYSETIDAFLQLKIKLSTDEKKLPQPPEASVTQTGKNPEKPKKEKKP
jgi:hypothetical protein